MSNDNIPLDASGRPVWVRVTGVPSWEADDLTVGGVYRVNGWDSEGQPFVTNDKREVEWFLAPPGHDATDYASWTPSPAPTASVPTSPDAPAPEPRRTVGAVVRGGEEGRLFIVVLPGVSRYEQEQRLLDDPIAKGGAIDSDEFVRWATRAECERHGIEYVERGEPTPVAAPTTAYVPRVGDVVYNCDDEPGKADRVIVGTDGDQFTARFLAPRSGEMTGYGGGLYWRYLRPASPAERIAAGLDKPDAPAAVRDDDPACTCADLPGDECVKHPATAVRDEDRDEIALRCYLTFLTPDGGATPFGEWAVDQIAVDAYRAADAFIAARAARREGGAR